MFPQKSWWLEPIQPKYFQLHFAPFITFFLINSPFQFRIELLNLFYMLFWTASELIFTLFSHRIQHLIHSLRLFLHQRLLLLLKDSCKPSTINNVFPVHPDVVVPVRAGLFMVEAKGVEQLMLDSVVVQTTLATQRHSLTTITLTTHPGVAAVHTQREQDFKTLLGFFF